MLFSLSCCVTFLVALFLTHKLIIGDVIGLGGSFVSRMMLVIIIVNMHNEW